MKKLSTLAATALMAATLVGIAAPAQAQVRFGWGTSGFFNPERTIRIRQQLWDLERDVDRADRRGTISDRDAFALRREVRSLRNWYEMSARNGLTFQEVRYLQDRVNRIRDRLRLERYGWDREDYWRNNGGNRNWRNGDRDNRWDRDRDNYGVQNRWDQDRDGVPDRLDPDDDNDGVRDDRDPDDDNDGLPDDRDPYPNRR
ncbi:MAG: hypothetical protein ABJA20_15510 [Novosphingobium sp.]